MKNIIFLLFIAVVFSCNSTQVPSASEINDTTTVVDSIIKKDTVLIKKDSIKPPLIKIFLPSKYRSKQEIQKLIAEIDAFVKREHDTTLKFVSIFTDTNGPCEIEKFYKNGELIMINYGCGDCWMVMGDETYYIKKNELIGMKTHTTYYAYNPCMSDKDCKENGITAKYKKENTKERSETYYLLDSLKLNFERKGNFNDTTYLSNDTLSKETILEDAIQYLNTKE